MEETTRVLAFVLAGGEGKRLAPLTRHVAKPAIPFHRSHRLIDFVLSNLRNSGIRAIHVLMQYQSQSILPHLVATWRADGPDIDGFVNPITGGLGEIPAYCGTADAVYRNAETIIDCCPDVVVVFGADHVYRMDVRQMIDFHLKSGADATVAALPVHASEALGLGVIETGRDGRIRRFAEKPARPAEMPSRPGYVLASMGNYVFSPRPLLRALQETHCTGGTDFGCDLLPSLVASSRLMAYDFTSNVVPGAAGQADPHYWRDVGTLDAYHTAQMDTLGPSPRFDLARAEWPIRGTTGGTSGGSAGMPAGPGSGAVPRAGSGQGQVQALALSPRTPPSFSSRIEHSILRRGVTVEEDALLSRCVVAENVRVGEGCRLRNAIVDADNWLPDGFEAGFDLDADRRRWPVSKAGIVVIPRGSFAAPRVAPPRCLPLMADRLRLVPNVPTGPRTPADTLPGLHAL